MPLYDANEKTTLNGIPRIWVDGERKVAIGEVDRSAVVASGKAVFYLTSDNTASGTALFTNVYKASTNFFIDDATNQYQIGGWTLSANKKSITVDVNRLGTVILGLIQTISAANGVVVYMQVKGDS